MKLILPQLLPVVLVFFMGCAAAGDRVKLPQYPQPVGEKCVEPNDVMRREHMNFITHQRDETVYKGIRGVTARHSLKDCIDCHAGYDDRGMAIPINAKGQFCESCHTYTAVSIDCFGCHRTTPGEVNRMRQLTAKSDQSGSDRDERKDD